MFVTRGSQEPDTRQTSALLTVMEKQMKPMVEMVVEMVKMVEKMTATPSVERRLGRGEDTMKKDCATNGDDH